MKYLPLLLFPLLLACNNDSRLSAEQIETYKHLDSVNKATRQSVEDINALHQHNEWENEMRRLILAAQDKPNMKEAYRIIDSTEDAIYAGNYPNWFKEHRERRPWRDSVARAEGLIK